MRYPSGNGGLPLHPSEVDLPESRFGNNLRNWDLHHRCWPRRRFEQAGQIYKTFRLLDSLEHPLPKDVHNMGQFCLHAVYSDPIFPKPEVVIDYLLEAYDRGETYNTGSLRKPEPHQLTPQFIEHVRHANLQDLRRRAR